MIKYKEWLVSILICTYNAKDTIKHTLKSCLNQTYQNFEILVHDDQSKDNTIDVIKSMWNKRIKIIKSWKKLWPYKGLNYLLDNAKWEYVAIQDHDDIWHPSKLEKQINYLEHNKKSIWCWTYWLEYYIASHEWYVAKPGEEFVTHWVAHTSLVFRNDLKYRYDTKIDYLCDWYFLKKILSKWNKSIYVYPEILTLHYNKTKWINYSNSWFNFNLKNFKRYFDVQWYSIKSFFHFPVFIILQTLPKSIKNFIGECVIRTQNKFQSEKILKHNNNISEMLKYL